jgi:bla regulator protein BlaR1
MNEYPVGGYSFKKSGIPNACLVAVVVSWLVITTRSWAQSLPTSGVAFESISVKPSHSDQRMMYFPMRDAVTVSMTNTSTRYLVEYAYDLQDFQLSGGPAWLDTQRYDIHLKVKEPVGVETPQPLTGDELQQRRRAMIRALLEDRFKLRVIEETKETPSYSLVLAQDGPTIPQRTVAPDAIISVKVLAEKGSLTMTGGSNAELARVLSGQLGCQVVDKTGRDGIYDATLRWTPDSRASLLAAVEEQLGMRLEEHVLPIRTYIVDEVERPAED